MDKYEIKNYKNSKNPFEDYLKNVHAYDYHGVNDDMSDDFERWLEKMDVDSLIDYGSKFAKKLLDLIK